MLPGEICMFAGGIVAGGDSAVRIRATLDAIKAALSPHEVGYYPNFVEHPVDGDGPIATGPFGTLSARRLDHPVEAYGYRLVEPDGRRMLPDRLAERGIAGPDIGLLQRTGRLDTPSGPVTLDEVSEPRRGQRFAFVMDTRLCDAVHALADGADLLVIESTFLDADADLAEAYGHLTAAQAGRG